MTPSDNLSCSSNPVLTCSSDISESPVTLLAVSDLTTSSNHSVNVATTALHLERYATELLQWLQCSNAVALADEALYYFETRHPELLNDIPLLFAWLSLFLAQHEDMSSGKTADVAARTIEQLDIIDVMPDTASKFVLKSKLTLLYWKHESDRQQLSDQRTDDSETGETTSSRPRATFHDEKGLLQWMFTHKDAPLTRQDIIDHVFEKYPGFAAAKTTAALKVWLSRFLRKHIRPNSLSASEPIVEPAAQMTIHVNMETPVITTEMHENVVMPISLAETHEDLTMPLSDVMTASVLPLLLPPSKPVSEESEIMRAQYAADSASLIQYSGKRRSCSGRYMLFSNEFKLRAVTMLDEGKSVAQVTAELGLKNSNGLHYWKSIRDKLVTSERKRFRLAGGGRRSSCSFEDELLTWVSKRHQQGQGTDVKAVLDYIKQSHSSFTEGKKEATLRKWILRFFKRCWRAPSSSVDSQDAEKSYIFV
ncbi:hypothetical protein CCR75_005312 [Bremia lactucae]|uniref:Uncharacterized protein n=1 Tax=Bremia lactucae TaxID=4779 RepID=A0A976FJM8_BRELC|nr:hypothetical protein CCR75_005312 [Bremia lactucae]